MTHPFVYKKARTERLMKPLRYTGEDNLPKEKITPRIRQASAPEEADQIDKRSPRPSSDANSNRRPSRSTSNGVMENKPTNQTNQTA